MLSWLLFSNTSCRTGSSCDFVSFLSLFFFFGVCFVVLVPVLVFLGGGEEKGTVAEVCVRHGGCVCMCVWMRARPQGGTATLWRVGK